MLYKTTGDIDGLLLKLLMYNERTKINPLNININLYSKKNVFHNNNKFPHFWTEPLANSLSFSYPNKKSSPVINQIQINVGITNFIDLNVKSLEVEGNNQTSQAKFC